MLFGFALGGCEAPADDDDGGADTGGVTQASTPSSMSDGDSDDPSAGSSDSAGELNAECTALCGRTPSVNDVQAACVPAILEEEGGYAFTEESCLTLSAAYQNGNATSAQCVACYLEADVAASDCTTAENTCF